MTRMIWRAVMLATMIHITTTMITKKNFNLPDNY